MASSQSDQHHQPKKEAGEASSDTNNPPSPPPPPPPPEGHSPATPGYPTPLGYPQMGFPPGYPSPAGQPTGYYTNGYNNYPYAQAPPADYYNMHQQQQQQQYRMNSFIRGITAGLVFIVIFMCLSSIITWLILRPQVPVVNIKTLSVSNFNASSALFTANWDANITIKNPNTKLRIYLDQIEVFMYYEDEEDLLASSFASPFILDTEKESAMQAKLAANNSDHTKAGVGIWVVEKMGKDRSSNGKVKFGMRMALWSTLKSGSWWTRRVTIRVFCEDLEVTFVGNSGTGNLANPNSKDCLVLT